MGQRSLGQKLEIYLEGSRMLINWKTALFEAECR